MRHLLYHAESDSLFETFTSKEFKKCMDYGCDDHTNESQWEERYKKEKEKQMSTKKLMTDWLVAKEQEETAAKTRFDIECKLYKAVMETVEIKKEGTTKYENDGIKLTITSRMNVSVDQTKAEEYPHLFKTKYEYSKTINKALSPSQIHLQEEMIVIKPGKPTFAIEVL